MIFSSSFTASFFLWICINLSKVEFSAILELYLLILNHSCFNTTPLASFSVTTGFVISYFFSSFSNVLREISWKFFYLSVGLLSYYFILPLSIYSLFSSIYHFSIVQFFAIVLHFNVFFGFSFWVWFWFNLVVTNCILFLRLHWFCWLKILRVCSI